MMKMARLSAERLAELVAGFPQARIAVVGDFFLDKYFEVDPVLVEVSVETGKPAHQVVRVRHSPGAAGTVINNFAALGCTGLVTIGYVGDDGDGFDLRRDLERLGCDTGHLVAMPDRMTPVYLKPRDITDVTLTGEHSRYDAKNRTPTPVEIEDRLLHSIAAVLPQVQALAIMDQVDQENCGGITTRVRGAIAELARNHPGKIFWADSRRFIRRYRNVIIKPNPFELLEIDNPPPGCRVDDAQVLAAARALRHANQAPLVVTRGAAGLWVSDPEWTQIPGVPVAGPIDPTGAGDSASAGAVSALCAGASLPEAAVVANLVASITIQQIGVTGTARPDQLEGARRRWAERCEQTRD